MQQAPRPEQQRPQLVAREDEEHDDRGTQRLRHVRKARTNFAPVPDREHAHQQRGEHRAARDELEERGDLERGKRAERDPRRCRTPVLAHEQLVQQQQQERRQHRDRQHRVSGRVRRHVRREPVEQPSDERTELAGNEPTQRELRGPGRCRERKRRQQVVGRDEADRRRERPQQQPEARRHRPHEIRAVRREQITREERIEVVRDREPRPSEREHVRLGIAGPPRVMVHRVDPRAREPQERERDEREQAGGARMPAQPGRRCRRRKLDRLRRGSGADLGLRRHRPGIVLRREPATRALESSTDRAVR